MTGKVGSIQLRVHSTFGAARPTVELRVLLERSEAVMGHEP